jgi:hypothetical protein
MSKLSQIRTGAPSLAPRIVMFAQEKFGKTSWAAYADKPIIMMSKGETGLLSLIETRRVPATTPYFPECTSWADALECVKSLTCDPHDYHTLVLDTGNGFEDLCAQYVCEQEFGGNWGEHGYAGFGRGDVVSKTVWGAFLEKLDTLRLDRGMSIIILHHAIIKTANNPTGKDYDQWRPACREKLWGHTHKWSDIIMRGGFDMTVSKDDKVTAESRTLFTENSPSSVGGNRYGLPPKITARPGAENLWKAFEAAMAKAKPTNETKQPAPANGIPAPAPAKAQESQAVVAWQNHFAGATAGGVEALKAAWTGAPAEVRKHFQPQLESWKEMAKVVDAAKTPAAETTHPLQHGGIEEPHFHDDPTSEPAHEDSPVDDHAIFPVNPDLPY